VWCCCVPKDVMDLILLLMEEMAQLMKVMDSVPETRSSARLL
jgi:hypothetical protein